MNSSTTHAFSSLLQRIALLSILVCFPTCYQSAPAEMEGSSSERNPFADSYPSFDTSQHPQDTPILPYPYTRQSEHHFSLIMLPDTQKYVRGDNTHFRSQIDWIIAHRHTMNTVAVIHVGDIVDAYDNSQEEWRIAKKTIEPLDENQIPYVISPGNHDYAHGVRDSSMFNEVFPLSTFKAMPTFGGAFEPNKSDNTYHIIESDVFPLVLLSLEVGPREEVLLWAEDVIHNYSEYHVILNTHAYLYHDNTLIGPGNPKNPKDIFPTDANVNDGQDIWDKLIWPNENIFMVLCGHVGTSKDPVANLLSTTKNGTPVYQQMLNYQRFPMDDNGYIKVLQFFPDDKFIIVSSYAPFDERFDPRAETQYYIINDTLFEN